MRYTTYMIHGELSEHQLGARAAGGGAAQVQA